MPRRFWGAGEDAMRGASAQDKASREDGGRVDVDGVLTRQDETRARRVLAVQGCGLELDLAS